MKLKILKIEVITQFVLTISVLLFVLFSVLFIQQKIELIYWGLLFLIGVFNLIGLVLRLFLVRSNLNFIYLFVVLTFFILSFLFYFFFHYDFERDVDRILIYLFLFGFLFNTYYLFYGYLLIKNWQAKTVEN